MGRLRPIRTFMKLTIIIIRTITLSLLVLLFGQRILCAHPGAEASLAHFTQEIQAKPGEQSLYIQRGIAYSNDGQYPQARADFEQAEKLGNPILVAFDFGVLHYRMGNFDAARRSFDNYLQQFPNHAQCLEYRARLLRDAGDYPAAVADFKQVFKLLQRPNPGHYVSVAEMLSSTGADGIDQALEIIDQGNEKLGITPQLQQYAIKLELARKQPDKAIERLRTLEPILGKSPGWKVDMGELMLQVGQPERAAALFEEASLQLDTLRKTPARLKLRARIDCLREATTR